MALINLRNALMAGKRLPYDAEVEYLESTGTQYINTGVVPTAGVSFEITAAFDLLTSGRFGCVSTRVVSSGTYTDRYYFGVVSGKWAAAVKSTSYNHNISTADNSIHDFKINNNGFYVDNVLKVSAGSSSVTNPFYLFDCNGVTASVAASAKVYSCKIYDANDILVLDLIPVRKGTVGYLYDRVTRKLFGNAGTGDFVLGPDVIDITWVDGENYGKNGSIEYNANLARIDDYIAVTGGHSITWKWGDSVLGTCYLIVYNAQKQQIDFWSPNSATGERTINLNATGAFVRYSIGKNFKNTTFFKDNTTGLYAVRNGKILLP